MNRKIFILSLAFGIFLSCNTGNTVENNAKNNQRELDIKEYLNRVIPNKNILHSVILLIPMYGCHSCIDASNNFVRNNIQHNNLIVIVEASTNKEVKVKFSEKIVTSRNFVIDTKIGMNMIQNSTAIYFDKGKINSVEQINFSKKDDFFSRIVDYIKN